MPTLTLHFGCHKTGSSSIQHSLNGLATEQWRYISTTVSGNESGGIGTAFLKEPWRFSRHQRKGISQQEALTLRRTQRHIYQQLIRETTSPQLLISAERIAGFSKDECSDMKKFFETLGCSVRAVGYLRPIASAVQSAFQQRIQGNPLSALANGTLQEALARSLPRYPSLVANLHAVFGQQNVALWGFDPAGFPRGDVVADFCGRLGIDADSSRCVRVNETQTLLAIKLIYLAARAPATAAVKHTGNRLDTGLFSQGRNQLLQQIRLDFADLPRFRILPSLLEELIAPQWEHYRSLDSLIECRETFSLIDSSPATPDENQQYIHSMDQLLCFSQQERQYLLDLLLSRPSQPSLPRNPSDTELTTAYCEQVRHLHRANRGARPSRPSNESHR